MDDVQKAGLGSEPRAMFGRARWPLLGRLVRFIAGRRDEFGESRAWHLPVGRFTPGRSNAWNRRQTGVKRVTEWDVETLSAKLHDIYQEEAHRRGDVRHADRYEDLSEETKEWDRVLARWILAEWEPKASKGDLA